MKIEFSVINNEREPLKVHRNFPKAFILSGEATQTLNSWTLTQDLCYLPRHSKPQQLRQMVADELPFMFTAAPFVGHTNGGSRSAAVDDFSWCSISSWAGSQLQLQLHACLWLDRAV